MDLNRFRVSLPRRLSRRLTDWTWSDGRYFIAAGSWVAAAGIITNGLEIFTILVPLYLFCGLWRTRYGRVHKVIREEFLNLWIAVVRQGALRGQLFGVALTSFISDQMRLAVIHYPKNKTDHLVFRGEGSAAAADDIAGRFAFAQGLGTSVLNMDAETPQQLGVTYTWRPRPKDIMPLVRYLGGNMHPGIAKYLLVEEQEGVSAEIAAGNGYSAASEVQAAVAVDLGGMNAEEQAAEMERQDRVNRMLAWNLGNVVNGYANIAHDVTSAAVLAVKRVAWSSSSFSGRELWRAPVTKIARAFQTDLVGLGVEDVELLGLTDLSRFVREGWDLADLEDYHELRATGVIPEHDDELEVDENGRVVNDLAHFPPKGTRPRVGRDWLFIPDADPDNDPAIGTYIRTLMSTKLPEESGPDDFDELKAVKAHWSAITFLGETMSGERESRRLTKSISLKRAWSQFREKSYETPEEKQARLDEEREHSELHAGGNLVQLFNLLVVISGFGSSPEVLEDAQSAFEAVSRKMELGLKPVKGQCRQARAFVSGVLGVSQL